MSFDLNHLTTSELEVLIIDAKRQIQNKQKHKAQEVYLQMVQLASSIGMSLDDVILQGRRQMGHKVASDKPKIAPKYQNPVNPVETWSGRGKQPRWIVTAISSGRVLNDFLIA